MSSTNPIKTRLVENLQQFAQEFISHYQKKHFHLPKIEKDEDWPSPCEVLTDVNENIDSVLSLNEVFWQPFTIEKEQGLSFENVERALELTLHSDIKTYFTTLFSESLDASCEEGQLSLLFAWNKDDFQRLQENIIGHILMKQRLKQKETVFFAVTDEEDMIISIDNEIGSVWVERVGCEPHKMLAPTLADFIEKLTPELT